jgi:hypothetical protein
MSVSGPTRISAEDRAEIIELYARYAWGLDLADPEMLLRRAPMAPSLPPSFKPPR